MGNIALRHKRRGRAYFYFVNGYPLVLGATFGRYNTVGYFLFLFLFSNFQINLLFCIGKYSTAPTGGAVVHISILLMFNIYNYGSQIFILTLHNCNNVHHCLNLKNIFFFIDLSFTFIFFIIYFQFNCLRPSA